ncbi:hypothetical protein ACQ86G_04730 [Roseateles chitinivorans]|uniref:hypothetical protein n=1 Tax=Roseateles chitinivorans TaxID=2917965 RepID=UPI003D66616A
MMLMNWWAGWSFSSQVIQDRWREIPQFWGDRLIGGIRFRPAQMAVPLKGFESRFVAVGS